MSTGVASWLLGAWLFGPSAADGADSRARRPTAQSQAPSRILDPSQQDIVNRVRGGDVATFETLFRENYDLLIQYAYSLVKSREVARDIVSDTFAALWKNCSGWQPKGSVRAYLLASVRHRAIDASRSARRWAVLWQRTAPDEIPVTGQAPRDPDARLDIEARLNATYAAIDAMRGFRREVMVLRWRAQWSVAEIAASLGISEASVHTHLSQALRVLRETLGARHANDSSANNP